MKAYLTNLLPRLQQYSQTLDKKELLVDQPWVLMDEDSNKQQYIFERDGKLIMSYNGKVQYGKWRYIPAAKSLVIDRGENDSLLLNHSFVSQGACILKKDGFIDDPWILINERVVPDLDLEKYLRSLLPESKSLKELKLEGCTLYYDLSSSAYASPYVGLKVTTLKDDDKVVNGIFKDSNDVYYVIENDVIISIYKYELFKTNSGILKIKRDLYSGPKKGDSVTIENTPAPDGEYQMSENDYELKRITIKNGVIVKIQHNNWMAVWGWFTLFILIAITIIIIISNN